MDERLTLNIRLAGPDDGPIVTELFVDLFDHYFGDQAPKPDDVERHVRETVMTAGTACEIALAESDGNYLGIVTFAVVYPAPNLHGQLVLKDLYVRRGARGQNIGRWLLQYLAKLALERNCYRVDWTAETTNPRALEFYDGLGVRREIEKIYYRLDGEALKSMAEHGTVKPQS